MRFTPVWIDAPDHPNRQPTLRIVRTPHDRPIDLLPTSSRPLGTFTHYHYRRTLPCPGLPDCPLCLQGVPYRWHGYTAAILLPTLEHVIFEYTAPLAQKFKEYLDEHNTLRGSQVTARRIAPYPTARITIDIRPAPPSAPTLYPEPDLARILCAIWQVPAAPAPGGRLTERHATRIEAYPENEDQRYFDSNDKRRPNQ